MPHNTPRRVLLPPGPPRRPFPRWVGVIVVLVVGVAIVGAFSAAYYKDFQLQREKATLERELDDLTIRNEQLREERRLLHTPEYIERIAREQLGLVKPDEIIVMIVPPTPTPTPAPTPPPAAGGGDERPWWIRWISALTGGSRPD
jgi:cell division protein FtsL